MTEAELQETVREIAKTTGWLYYHTYRSRRSPAGFPDVVLVRPPRVVFAELKSDTGKVTKEQRMWLDELLKCVGAVETYVWRPADVDVIASILSPRYEEDPPSDADLPPFSSTYAPPRFDAMRREL